MTGYEFTPITLKRANNFVEKHHRHNKPVAGHKFSVGLEEGGELIGVGIAGRPVSRHLDDGRTLEVTRVCVKEGYPGACSKLYARLKRIGQLFGYERIKTYTLLEEAGSSLRAIGAVKDKRVRAQRWKRPDGDREHQAVYDKKKVRWELVGNSEE